MSKYGAVIKFRDGVDPAEIAKAMNQIKHLLDLPATVEEPVYANDPKVMGRRIVKYRSVPFAWRHLVHEYNPDHGDPVWYVP